MGNIRPLAECLFTILPDGDICITTISGKRAYMKGDDGVAQGLLDLIKIAEEKGKPIKESV